MKCEPQERRKVLFITNWYPTKESPGTAVWVREQAKAVRQYDEVVVLHCAGAAVPRNTGWRMEREHDQELSEGVTTYRLWHRPAALPRSAFLLYVYSVLRSVRRLSQQGFRPDVIHVHVYDAAVPAIIIGKLWRIPVVVSEHFSSFPRRLLGRLDVCKAWLAFRWADRVLPVSAALQAAIEGYRIHARFTVVPNVADPTVFAPAEASSTPHADPKRLLYVGQLAPIRGIPYLLRALCRLRETRDDWRVDIVGAGAGRADCEQLSAELQLGDKVTFHGFKPKAEVAGFMRRADLFVLPSLCETFSAPLAEALTAGTPVVATRCGGPEELVTDEVGMLVPAGDADALCAGLDAMLNRLHLYSRTRISQYARERFAPQVVGAQLHMIYQSLAGSDVGHAAAQACEPTVGSARGRGPFDWRHFMRLVQALIIRELKGRYRRSLLGPAWAVLQPLGYLVMFTLVGHILRISSEGVPYVVFTCSALVPWTFFSNAVSRCGPTFYFKAAIVRKIALPREAFPVAEVIGSLVDLGVTALMLAAMMLWFRTPIGWPLLWCPLLVVLTMVLATGVGFIVSALGTYQFDTVFALPFLLQLWMFATPVMYPLSSVPASWQGWYRLNPMVGLIDGFRAVLVEARAPDLPLLAFSIAGTLVVWGVAWPLFRFTAPYFADVL